MHKHRRLLSPAGLTQDILAVCVSQLKQWNACPERWKVLPAVPEEHYGGFNIDKRKRSQRRDGVLPP